MATQMFVNLPIQDLPRSVAFFTALGFRFDPRFTSDKATCMIVGEHSFVMLLTQPFFQTFTDKPVSDAHRTTEVLICLSRDSRAAVDEIVRQAIAAGGKAPRAAQDHGFMYQHGFEDPDGHLWEVMFMEPGAIPPTES
ncbi:VOC family protein [Acidovorax sp. SUPP2539]|uniref:VOC family protein n=1 Tax=Acidovorax sp. SUPP2539 TaxID=2920878 RepID=UPI0023DE2494|nr:VOC family protein [Acidovorax sp. SUPP2539]GKS89262.1 VOC family protein [Acidovorax sp. SUPP2539]